MTTESTALATLPYPPPLVAERPAKRRAAANTCAMLVALAAVSTGLVLPLGVVGVIACACALALAGVGVSAGPLRSALAAQAGRRDRDDRRYDRERMLVPASNAYHTLAELTRLVDRVEVHDPELARRSDLEALLDRFAVLTVAHERALRAAEMSDRVQLERIRESCAADSGASAKRLELCERRLQCLDDCEAKADRFADELAIIVDTICLTAQRAACPDDLPADDCVERQLTELDESTEARRQLALELHGQ